MDKVLIIDDNKFIQGRLSKTLENGYVTRGAEDGDAGIAMARDWEPDIILLDVEMPGRNGYEVCDELKRDTQTKETPVVFLSSKSSIRERMLGYEVGAEDYLVKTCSEEELIKKVDMLVSFAHEKKELRDSVSSANKTAMEAMSTSFELGKAVRYVECSFKENNFDDLSKLLLSFMNDMELSCVVMFLSRGGFLYYSNGGAQVTPIETQLMEMLRTGDRFTDFGCRTVINYPRVALLVKNMPLNDRSRYGRIKDTLPFVLGATDAKVRVIDAEQALYSQSAELSCAIESTQLTLASINEDFENNLYSVSSIMTELISSMTSEMNQLGLDYDQEEIVCGLVENASKEINTCLQGNKSSEELLGNIIELLKKVAAQQQKIISDNLSSDSSEDVSSEDIELF